MSALRSGQSGRDGSDGDAPTLHLAAILAVAADRSCTLRPAGDFLLARASVSLARLRSIPVVELLSKVIEHLVKARARGLGAGVWEVHHRAPLLPRG